MDVLQVAHARVHNTRVCNLRLFLCTGLIEAKFPHYIISCEVILELRMAAGSNFAKITDVALVKRMDGFMIWFKMTEYRNFASLWATLSDSCVMASRYM